jgi:hypothetical protein
VLSIALDSDRQPENDFIPLDDGDTYQYADLIYELIYSPENEWLWRVYKLDGTEVESQAQAFIYRNTVAIAIPEKETKAEDPAFRMIIWSYPGQYLIEDVAVDVTNDYPTERPVPVELYPMVYIDDQGEKNFLGSDQLCQWGGCQITIEGADDYFSPKSAKCECSGCTDDPDCQCALYYKEAAKVTIPVEGGSRLFWHYAADQGEVHTTDEIILRKCFCVERAE